MRTCVREESKRRKANRDPGRGTHLRSLGRATFPSSSFPMTSTFNNRGDPKVLIANWQEERVLKVRRTPVLHPSPTRAGGQAGDGDVAPRR